MKSSMNTFRKTGILIASGVICILAVLSGCSQGASDTGTNNTTTSTASIPASAGRVEVNYFYESGACFCLELATEWVNTVIGTDYKSYLDSGDLIYITHDTTDPANNPAKEAFDSSAYGLFITTVTNGESQVKEVKSLWFYLDSSGTNELLKSKFIGILTKELNTALGVQ